VPATLEAGRYALGLSFRWDSESTKQVWSGCSDVEIVRPRESPALEISERYAPVSVAEVGAAAMQARTAPLATGCVKQY